MQNTAAVRSTARGDTVKLKVTLPCMIFSSSSSASLEIATPAARPIAIVPASTSNASQKSTRAILPLPMPSMLYRPNSRFRRRIRKELVYRRKMAPKTPITPLPRESMACISSPPLIPASTGVSCK